MSGFRLSTAPVSHHPGIRASGKDLETLAVTLARKGIDLYRDGGGLLSLPEINAKIEALHLKAEHALELKIAAERADLGLPL